MHLVNLIINLFHDIGIYFVANFKIDIFNTLYSLICILVLIFSLIMNLTKIHSNRKLYHTTISNDLKEIFTKKTFETRTQGLMFCSWRKSNLLGMFIGEKADSTIIIRGDALKKFRPISLNFHSFFLPWNIMKTILLFQWVSKSIGDVKIIGYKLKDNELYIDKAEIVPHKGKLKIISILRNLGLGFINIPLLFVIYMPLDKNLEFVLNHKIYFLTIFPLALFSLIIFFKNQLAFNAWSRK